jgi:PHD/YefM family antitoxin component YafN of YafNO toxin-antitoxin module
MNKCSATDLRKNLPAIQAKMEIDQAPVTIVNHGKPCLSLVSPTWGELVDLVQTLHKAPDLLPPAELSSVLAGLIYNLENNKTVTLQEVVLKLVEQAKIIHDYHRLVRSM